MTLAQNMYFFLGIKQDPASQVKKQVHKSRNPSIKKLGHNLSIMYAAKAIMRTELIINIKHNVHNSTLTICVTSIPLLRSFTKPKISPISAVQMNGTS